MPRAVQALAAYTALALIATWPLARGLGRDVPSDLGDPILNMWILAWDCEQLLAILRGDLSRLTTFFDANIFYPSPLTLAYSEHLIPQALQILPVYAATGNPILCYNLLFLSTIVLSGLGTYLLVRELTGSALAGFVAGLLFAFAPYRVAQSPHLQVLSAQWMPFALYGLRRYFETGRLTALAGGTTAVVLQGLSCGYYLLYFTPFAAAYVLWEVAQRRLWTSRRTWLHLAGAGVVAAAVTIPFVLPYAEARERFDMARGYNEVASLSADVYSYATASPRQPLWGGVIDAFPKAEGELFPGFVPLALALIGLFVLGPTQDARTPAGWRRLAVLLLGAAAMAYAALAAVTLALRRVDLDLWLFEIRATNVTQLLLRTAIAFAAVLALSPRARARTAALLRDRGFFLLALAAALWLSLGPLPRALGRPIELAAPYAWLYEHVPGVDGVRVPARFAMIAALMLAVLGGYGAAALARRRWSTALLAGMAAAFLLEGTAVPFVMNRVAPVPGYTTPDARLYRPGRAPHVYEVLDDLDQAVLAELPLGLPGYDLRAMFYSTVHWHPILNGYSGFFPGYYPALAAALDRVPRDPALALRTLRSMGATHVLVHEGAYLGNEGEETSAALRTHGAVELYRENGDVLLAIPR